MKERVLLLVGAFGCLFTAVNPLSAQIWTPTSAPTNSWTSVASSADGSKLVAAIAQYGGIYISTNSGAAWAPTSAPSWANWHCVASSADGTTLVAVSEEAQGNVYISTDSGATWNDCSGGMLFPPMPMFDVPYGYAVCLSADGTELVVAENMYDWSSNTFDCGVIFTSTNTGTTWNLGYESGYSQYWTSVACSADGSKLVAAAYRGGIYTSTNSGATWTLTSAPNASWTGVAASADGTRFAAVSRGIYISTDSGTTWNDCSGGMVFWPTPVYEFPIGYAVCLSADGTKLVVAEDSYYIFGLGPGEAGYDYGFIYTSTNSGVTWTGPGAGYQFWSSVACSADGSKLVAAANGGGIYTSQTTPAPVLNIVSSSNSLVLSWILPSTDFFLQQNSDLTTTNWEDVTNPPALNLANLQNQVALPLPAGNAFYRLKTP